MKIKYLFSIALLAAINYCVNAQPNASGWITTGSGTGSSSSSSSTNYLMTNQAAVMTMTSLTQVQSLTNTITTPIGAFVTLMQTEGFSQPSTSTLIVSNAGQYYYKLNIQITPTTDADTNKAMSLAVTVNDTLYLYPALFRTPTIPGVSATYIADGIITCTANSTVKPVVINTSGATISVTFGNGSLALYNMQSTGGSDGGDISTASSNNIITQIIGGDSATSNAVNNRVTSILNDGEWGLFGITFDNGDYFRTYANSVQKGHFIWSGDGNKWEGGEGDPQYESPSGVARDTCVIQVGTNFYASSTTNINASNSVAFSIGMSYNLQQWNNVTNISPAFVGETLSVTNAAVFGPFATVVDTNVWMAVAVCTNWNAATWVSAASNTFKIRMATCPVSTYPYGWTAWVELNNGTGISSIIDLTPFYDSVTDAVWAWYKEESLAPTIKLGKFASKSIVSSFSATGVPYSGTDLLGAWTQGSEAPWMVRLPNGKYRIYYNKYTAGLPRFQGHEYMWSDTMTTNLSDNTAWYDTTNVAVHIAQLNKEFQNFKPLVLTNSTLVQMGLAAARSGGSPVGRLSIKGGNYYRQPITNQSIQLTRNGMSAIGTDYASLLFGTESFPAGGMFAKNDNTVTIFAPSTNSSDIAGPFSYAKSALVLSNGAVIIPAGTTISGDGSGLTGITSTGQSKILHVYCATNVVVCSNSTTLSNSPLELTLTTGVWNIEYFVNESSSSPVAAGNKMSWVFSGTATDLGGHFQYAKAATVSTSAFDATWKNYDVGNGLYIAGTLYDDTGDSTMRKGAATLAVTANGTLTCKMAQSTATAGHTVTLVKGSYIKATKID